MKWAKNVSHIRSFLGLVLYYHQFIEGFSIEQLKHQLTMEMALKVAYLEKYFIVCRYARKKLAEY